MGAAGDFTTGESPLAASVDAKWHARIVHATLELDGAELNGADVLPHDYQRPQGFSVILSLGDVQRAREIFAALAEGGAVNMPFQATFWSPGFGVLVDRFGTPWEINCAASGNCPSLIGHGTPEIYFATLSAAGIIIRHN